MNEVKITGKKLVSIKKLEGGLIKDSSEVKVGDILWSVGSVNYRGDGREVVSPVIVTKTTSRTIQAKYLNDWASPKTYWKSMGAFEWNKCQLLYRVND